MHRHVLHASQQMRCELLSLRCALQSQPPVCAVAMAFALRDQVSGLHAMEMAVHISQGLALRCAWARGVSPHACWLPSMGDTSPLGRWEGARKAPLANPPCITSGTCTAFHTSHQPVRQAFTHFDLPSQPFCFPIPSYPYLVCTSILQPSLHIPSLRPPSIFIPPPQKHSSAAHVCSSLS